MDDPNVTYKLAFAELADQLGRPPTCNELLPLHEEYKRGFLALPSEVERADKGFQAKLVARAAAGRPEPTGFSRKPAPQAGTEEESTRTREAGEQASAAGEPLSGPRIIAEEPGAASEPDASSSPPRISQTAREGSRGAAGGLVLRCHACGQLWERPATRGRPQFKCPECRR